MSINVPIEIHTSDQWVRNLPIIKLNPKVPLVTLERAIIAHLTDSDSTLSIDSLIENFDLFSAVCQRDLSHQKPQKCDSSLSIDSLIKNFDRFSAVCETSLNPTKSPRPTKHAFSKTLHEMGFEEGENGKQKKEHKLIFIETDGLGSTDVLDFMHQKTPKIVQRTTSRKRSILKVAADSSSPPPAADALRMHRHVSFGGPSEGKASDPDTFSVQKANAPCGAIVTAINLRVALNLEVIRDLRKQLMKDKVLVIRQQDTTPLSESQLITLTKYFGAPVESTSGQSSPDHPEVLVVSNKGSGSDADGDWQSDLSYRQKPAELSIASVDRLSSSDGGATLALFSDSHKAYMALRFKQKPAEFSIASVDRLSSSDGGATHALFSDSHKAYMALPSSERMKLNEFKCVHKHDDDSRNVPEEQPVVHPLVIMHPEMSRPSLFVQSSTASIQGMSDADSATKLKELLDHQAKDRFVFKHSLQQGDVLVWDNRAVLYRLVGFSGGADSSEESILKQTMTRSDAAPVGLIDDEE